MTEFYKRSMTPNRIRKGKKKPLAKTFFCKTKIPPVQILLCSQNPFSATEKQLRLNALKLQLNCSNLRLSGEQRAPGALWRASLPS